MLVRFWKYDKNNTYNNNLIIFYDNIGNYKFSPISILSDKNY